MLGGCAVCCAGRLRSVPSEGVPMPQDDMLPRSPEVSVQWWFTEVHLQLAKSMVAHMECL